MLGAGCNGSAQAGGPAHGAGAGGSGGQRPRGPPPWQWPRGPPPQVGHLVHLVHLANITHLVGSFLITTLTRGSDQRVRAGQPLYRATPAPLHLSGGQRREQVQGGEWGQVQEGGGWVQVQEQEQGWAPQVQERGEEWGQQLQESSSTFQPGHLPGRATSYQQTRPYTPRPSRRTYRNP